jgi:antitoxin ParD1/3/4
MSAIGSYVVLRRQVLATCIERANEIRTESTGWWIFRRMKSVGNEVVRDALRLLRERDELQAHRMDALRRDVAAGLKDLDAGKSVPLDGKALQGIKTRGKAKLAATKGKANK